MGYKKRFKNKEYEELMKYLFKQGTSLFTGFERSTGDLDWLIKVFNKAITYYGINVPNPGGIRHYDNPTFHNPNKFYRVTKLRRDRIVPYYIEFYDIITEKWYSSDYPVIFFKYLIAYLFKKKHSFILSFCE